MRSWEEKDEVRRHPQRDSPAQRQPILDTATYIPSPPTASISINTTKPFHTVDSPGIQ